jgi:transposase
MNLAPSSGKKEALKMPRKKYLINLSESERSELLELTRKGELKARKMKRALLLLKADEGLSDPQIMAAIDVSRPTVERIRKRFVAGGLEQALNEDPRPGQRRKLDGRGEAQLLAVACSQAPDGHDHWTLRLLADKLVQLEVVETISYETVRRTLKKTN